MKHFLCALLIAAVPLSTAQAADQDAAPEAETANGKDADAKAEPFDPAQMMAVLEKLFPAQPEPLPERLALSRVTVEGLFPDGTYARLMDGMMDSFVDRIMNLSEADFGAKTKDGTPATKATLREKAIKEDPHFEERMRIMERVITDEVAKIGALMEPKLREGLARSMARRFDEKQLGDINAFLATDSGRAFGGQSMAMWVDPDVIRGMIGSFPEILGALPGAMKRLETETAHLPKPKKKDEGKKAAAKAE